MTFLKLSSYAIEKNIFYFLKSTESRLASSTGGREEPKPLSTLQAPPPLQICQHQSACVLVFHNIFFKRVRLALYYSIHPKL